MSTSLTTSHPIIRNIHEAAKVAHEYDAVVTAGPEASEVAHFGHPNHLVVSFDDVTDQHLPDAPTREQVRRIIEWGAGQDGALLVHCHAGISRSTASAWGIAIARGADPRESLEMLRDAHPTERGGYPRPFWPNRLIVSHLEAILERPELRRILTDVVRAPW